MSRPAISTPVKEKLLAALEIVRKVSPTLIINAHKLSTVHADHIAVIQGGVVTACGTFDKVSKQSGCFRQAYDEPGRLAAAAETTEL